MSEVSLQHIEKVYPHSEKKKSNLKVTDEGVLAVQDFNLNISDREFIVLVGPSGCGKSTTLRMVAGVEEITRGELYIDGKLVNDVEPMPIKYPTEFKVKAIRRYEKGESIKELCKELNISQSTLYHWRKQYCSIQTDTRTYTPAEFDAISRRLRKVEHELEVIRLSGYIARIPL